ncbi:AAA family ATPase [Fusobacterium polymorphum]|uniref:AAA family ATPase n=1 Tax=Fusobacterium nucleatum subsp. polymorphum TaxID=76857 RepID=UPI00300A5EA8
MKIHIIGYSGTGKTYLAKKLSNKYNIPHYDLDNIYWDNSSQKYGVKTEIEKRNKLLQNILEKDDWIIEGIYYKWLEQSFKNADIIYILDLPKYIYKLRIIKRFIKRKLKLEISKKETLKSLLDLLKWTDKFQNEDMKEIIKILEKYKEKVYFVKSKKEIKEILKRKLF